MRRMKAAGRIYDRALFAVAAAWNLCAAAVLIFYPEFLLARLQINDPAARLLARSFASSVTTWGAAYALVALAPRRFRDFAWLGAISKSIFFVIYAVALFSQQIPLPTFIPALVDLIMAALFAEFLWRTKTNAGQR